MSVFCLSASPTFGDFIADIDPSLSLDWNNRDFRGLPELRDHVLAQAGLRGLCAQTDVLIIAGASEANYLAIMQLLEPGDDIVIETPGWPQAEVLARAKGANVVKVARSERDNWALPLDAPRRDPAYTFDFPYEPEQSNRAGAGSECVARNR